MTLPAPVNFTLPSGYSFMDLNDLAANLNAAFDGGIASAWALAHLSL